jgi:Mce-associated membrane protein
MTKPLHTNHNDSMEEPRMAAPIDTEATTARTTRANEADGADIADEAEAADIADEGEAGDAEDEPLGEEPAADTGHGRRGISWTRALAFGLLPAVALLLTIAAGFLKWQDSSVRDAQSARIESVRAATDSTIALLSYRPDTVEKDLSAARDRLTGTFRDSYTSLTHDVVIPGAQQKQISAQASVPAAASVRASGNHAVVLLSVNQTVIVGNDAPTNTASSVRVTLDKINDRWLISQFDPV